MIGIAERQGKKTLELRQAELVYVGDVKTGTSMRTGSEWRIRNVNLKISLGANAEGKQEYMLIAVKCAGDLCDRIGMTAVGTHIHAFIRLGLNTHFMVPQTDCTLVDFTL